jgi:hypothetical protein
MCTVQYIVEVKMDCLNWMGLWKDNLFVKSEFCFNHQAIINIAYPQSFCSIYKSWKRLYKIQVYI